MASSLQYEIGNTGLSDSRSSTWTDKSSPQTASTNGQSSTGTEKSILRSSVASDFPWISQEFEPIRTGPSQRALQRSRGGPAVDRNASGRSGRSSRGGLREDFEDLGLIASDMDYYAGAVSDYIYQDIWAEDEESLDREEDGDSVGRIRIIRPEDVQRGASRQSKRGEKDADIVTWDGPDDPENPKNWSRRRKWLATMTVSLLTFIAPVSSSMIAPALAQIKTDLHIPSDLEVELALSVFVLGFALGPLLLGPMSELFGRRIVLLLSGLFYLIFNLAAGFSTNAAEVIAFRFLSGIGGSAPLGIGGGVLADIWMPQERGKAMALYSLMPLLGPAVGPVAGGFIAQWSTWRWVFWSTSIAAAVITITSTLLLKETYAATLLARKKKRLIARTGNPSLRTEFDHPHRSFTSHLSTALQRPFRMLLTQPIVQILALYIGYLFGVLYLVLASFPQVWSTLYSETPAIAGLNYLSLGLGFFLGTQIAARFADPIYKHLKSRSTPSGPDPETPGLPHPSAGIGRSEFRVPLMFPGALLVPIGLLIYGWGAHARAHWAVPNLGAVLFGAGNQLVFQNCQIYLVDAYTRYAASATAATAVLRSLGGFAFPLFAPGMYGALGYGWGNTVLAAVGIVVGLPVPAVLWVYGERLRKRGMGKMG